MPCVPIWRWQSRTSPDLLTPPQRLCTRNAGNAGPTIGGMPDAECRTHDWRGGPRRPRPRIATASPKIVQQTSIRRRPSDSRLLTGEGYAELKSCMEQHADAVPAQDLIPRDLRSALGPRYGGGDSPTGCAVTVVEVAGRAIVKYAS